MFRAIQFAQDEAFAIVDPFAIATVEELMDVLGGSATLVGGEDAEAAALCHDDRMIVVAQSEMAEHVAHGDSPAIPRALAALAAEVTAALLNIRDASPESELESLFVYGYGLTYGEAIAEAVRIVGNRMDPCSDPTGFLVWEIDYLTRVLVAANSGSLQTSQTARLPAPAQMSKMLGALPPDDVPPL